MRPDGDENRKLYGRNITNKEILGTDITAPHGVRSFIATLNKYSGARTATASRAEREPLAKKGRRLTLGDEEIHFATGQFSIPSDAETTLSGIAGSLRENPSWRIRVEGYTDNVGIKAANETLSERRAESVVDWFVANGVDRSRLTAKGYGEVRPVGDNATEDGRAKNRRVELVRE